MKREVEFRSGLSREELIMQDAHNPIKAQMAMGEKWVTSKGAYGNPVGSN